MYGIKLDYATETDDAAKLLPMKKNERDHGYIFRCSSGPSAVHNEVLESLLLIVFSVPLLVHSPSRLEIAVLL